MNYRLLISTIMLTVFLSVGAQVSSGDLIDTNLDVDATAIEAEADSVPAIDFSGMSVADSLMTVYTPDKNVMSISPLPRNFFMPMVYMTYILPDTVPDNVFAPEYSGNPAMQWLEDLAAVNRRVSRIRQQVELTTPSVVRYNFKDLPEPPKQFFATVDPESHIIEITELVPEKSVPTLESTEVKKIHWINTFNASLQFSQAYVSPNWYQGGNNNLNMLLNLFYNIKLNQEFHPNLLFDSTVQYKLGMNSAPDDTIRSYNISEDIFQVNSTFGYKAVHNWYYTVNMQFKTQLLNSYKSNSNTLRSALFSPGELNIGVGMTYFAENAKKTWRFDASISPLSYNMMICTNRNMNETAYGIKPGHKTVSNIGSSLECKLSWKITDNISLRSRLFGFTDYDRAYADFENTLVFEINKYLTTQIFAHLRYDTDTPDVGDPGWRKLQLKEILSLGFAYKFVTH